MLLFRGYSLVELMMTLTIMSILMVITIPMTQHFFDREANTTLQEQLIHAMQYARHEARARGVAVGICASDNQAQCGGEWIDGQLIFTDVNGNGSIDKSNQRLSVIQQETRGGRLFLRSYPAYRDYLLFYPTGLLQNDNGTFWYCHDKANKPAWALVFNKAGIARIDYPNQQGNIKGSDGKALMCV